MLQFNIMEYRTAKHKLNINDNAARRYMKRNKKNGIPAKVYSKFPFAEEVNNDLRSAVEEFEFKLNPPTKYLCYVDLEKRRVTTWTGQELGTITNIGQEFRSNFGDKRQYITISAINGLKYGGYFFKSAGDYATIRKLK